MDKAMINGFSDEMQSIIKEGGIIGTGIKAIKGLFTKGGRGLGGLWKQTQSAYKRGAGGQVSARASRGGGGQLARKRAADAAKATAEGGTSGGMMGGLRAAMKTPGGAAAAVGAGGVGAAGLGYAALKRRSVTR